jgi:dienelactone hydrolase
MKIKAISIFVGIFLFVSLFAAPSPALAWTTSPQKVTFLNAQGITLTGWLFKPAGTGPFPAVVMMHGCAGVFSYSDPTKGIANLYREWADRLAAEGYVALLVDSFTPRKAPQNQCGQGSSTVSEVKARPNDAYAALRFLTSQSYIAAKKVGLLGWSQGGSSGMATLDVTQTKRLYHFRAAAVFYPGCGLSNTFGGLNESTWKPYAPFIILIGSADKVVSLATCRTRVTNAQALGALNTKLLVYKGAQHKFDNAREISDTFTQADVDAKIAADARVMMFFAFRLR